MRAGLAFGMKLRKKQPGKRMWPQAPTNVCVWERQREKMRMICPGLSVQLSNIFRPVALKAYLPNVVGLHCLPLPSFLLLPSRFPRIKIALSTWRWILGKIWMEEGLSLGKRKPLRVHLQQRKFTGTLGQRTQHGFVWDLTCCVAECFYLVLAWKLIFRE